MVLAPINMHKAERLCLAVESLYGQLREHGIEALLYDRKEWPGVVFTDLELIGIPHRLVPRDRGLDTGTGGMLGRLRSDVSRDSARVPLGRVTRHTKLT